MIIPGFRDLTDNERTILNRLLETDFPGRDQIVEQLRVSRVKTIDENGSLEIQTDSPVKASSVKSRVPTEGEIEDSDGVIIHFLVHPGFPWVGSENWRFSTSAPTQQTGAAPYRLAVTST